ncbi:tRNA pseudouridine(38-40) synthase TruA [Halobacteriales archaeon QS_6_71_20]|nr:MAG: tRNA pseudouridine(38-40) synthase TruA [Halobacteriales archaeon QS_6_71_20]
MRAYRVAYDGRPFYGFQRQPDVPTVEDTLLDALAALDVLGGAEGGPDVDGASDADSDGDAAPTADGDRATRGGRAVPSGYAAAGRTDRGVSAVRQTVAFDAPDWLSPGAFNGELPGSVRVWAAAAVSEGFHATHDAVRRTYRYHLHAPGASPDRARAAADRLSGRHDVHNLTSDDRGPRTRRDLSVSIDAAGGEGADSVDDPDGEDGVGDPDGATAPGEFLVLTVAAGGFPREFVRRLATLVRGVAVGDTGLDRVEAVLGEEPLSGPRGVAPASPGPLLLADVAYSGVEFEPDPDAVASLTATFGERRVDALARGRVLGDVLAATPSEQFE